MPALARPETRYARCGEISIAYQHFGTGELDVVITAGWLITIELAWDHPKLAEGWERLGAVARVVMFDRRGTGLSDAVDRAPTLEERMDDLVAVMDAAGLERAVLYGSSEGAPLSILFAATYPERVQALVLYGAMARTTRTDSYPYGNDVDALLDAGREFVNPYWGQGASAEIAAPSVADEPEVRAYFARMERASTRPAFLRQSFLAFIDTDVTDVLGSIQAPTLVLHRRYDRLVDVRAGRWLAERIPGAKFVELPGSDHNYWFDAPDLVNGEIEEFLLGRRLEREPDRALLTVLFTDIVGSTEKAAEFGDARWRELLDEHQTAARAAFARHRGREVKAMGDGFLATFDGPARAIRCAQAIIRDAAEVGLQVRAGIHTGECEL